MIASVLVLAGALSMSQANAAAAVDPARAPNLSRAVPLGTLDIPDEIAPAILPYMQCLYAGRGIQMPRGDEVITPAVPAGTDCGSHRQEAARRADRMLRNQRRGTGAERATYVEAVLASVDRFVSEIPEPGTLLSDPVGKPDESHADQAHAPN